MSIKIDSQDLIKDFGHNLIEFQCNGFHFWILFPNTRRILYYGRIENIERPLVFILVSLCFVAESTILASMTQTCTASLGTNCCIPKIWWRPRKNTFNVSINFTLTSIATPSWRIMYLFAYFIPLSSWRNLDPLYFTNSRNWYQELLPSFLPNVIQNQKGMGRPDEKK